MAETKPKALRPVCTSCAAELRAGGFRVKFAKDAQLHMDVCFVCGKRLPVHAAEIAGRRKRKKFS